MMDPDDSDDGIAQAAPVWAVFGDLMSGLLGVFVLILMGVLVAQMDLSATLAAETTLDLSASWRLAPGWQLTARLDNATDEARVPARDYQGLGRQAWLVLRWSLGPGAAR